MADLEEANNLYRLRTGSAHQAAVTASQDVCFVDSQLGIKAWGATTESALPASLQPELASIESEDDEPPALAPSPNAPPPLQSSRLLQQPQPAATPPQAAQRPQPDLAPASAGSRSSIHASTPPAAARSERTAGRQTSSAGWIQGRPAPWATASAATAVVTASAPASLPTSLPCSSGTAKATASHRSTPPMTVAHTCDELVAQRVARRWLAA